MIGKLEPYPAYKPSGVERLRNVPVHWEVRRLACVGRFTKGRGGTTAEFLCIRYGDLHTQYRYYIERVTAFVSHDTIESYESYKPIRYGNVFFAGSGETIEDTRQTESANDNETFVSLV